MDKLSNPIEENIKVIVRLKPNYDKDRLFLTHNIETNSITVPGRDEFIFDRVGDSEITQEEIFENCKSLFQSFIDGYNATIFAYGQTGSGKTFTMTGDSDEVGNTKNPGLIPRGLSFIFDKVNERALSSGVEYLIKCSFVEIYNEQIYDLLDHQQQRLNLRFNITQEVYLEQCTEIVMDNPKDANKILQRGLQNRHIASTEMNRESSRSHAVFIIVLESRESQGEIDNIKKSCLYLVDLAGSERQKDSKAETLRLKEAGMINKSLLALSMVIRKLVESAKSNKTPYIAYRDSKLTLLLKDALGGNSKTALVACVHNDIRFMADTWSTIQFASSVKMIRNKAKINVNIHGDNETLRKEVCFLQEQLLKYKSPQMIQNHEFDFDLVWKKRFITAMALRSCLSLDVSTLNNQIAHSNNMNLRLEKTLDNLKMEREIKDRKLKYLEEKLEENIINKDDFEQLLNNTLKKLSEYILNLDEQIKSDELQIELDHLTNELAKAKSLNLLAVSDQTLIHSLLKDYNNVLEFENLNQLLTKVEGQDIEMINLQQELSQTRYKNSVLKRKIHKHNIAQRDERRRLEGEITSMKCNLKIVDEQREAAVVDRRRTLLSINDLHKQAHSPIKNVVGINCRRRTQKPKEVIVEEDEDGLQPLEEWLKKNDQEMINLDKINELETNLRIKQTEIGTMEYSIKEYKKEIDELRNMLFLKENLENNLKDIEQKYISTNMTLEESNETIKRLEKEFVLLEASKDKIIKKLTEQKYNLEDEIRIIEEAKEVYKEELEQSNISMVYLKDEIKKRNELLASSQMECFERTEEINALILKNLSVSDELAKIKKELSIALKGLEASENIKLDSTEMTIGNQNKIALLEESNCDKENSTDIQLEENEFLIVQLSYEIKLLKKQIEDEKQDTKEANEVFTNELERRNISMVYLNDEIKRLNELFTKSQNESSDKKEEINVLNLRLLSDIEELADLKNELFMALKNLEINESFKQKYNEMVIENLKKITQLEKNNSDKENSTNIKLQENEFLIMQLSDEIKLLKKQIEENNKENSLKHFDPDCSPKTVLLLSPKCTSSPINRSRTINGDSISALVDELMISNSETDKKLKVEQKTVYEVTKIIETLFNEFHLPLGESLVDNMITIQAKVISNKHDYEDLVIKKMQLEERIKYREEYCKTLSEALETSRQHRDNMKKDLDELIDILPSGGHANHKQKIEYFTKYKEANARLKVENLQLVDDNTAMKIWLTEKHYLDLFNAFNIEYKKRRYNPR